MIELPLHVRAIRGVGRAEEVDRWHLVVHEPPGVGVGEIVGLVELGRLLVLGAGSLGILGSLVRRDTVRHLLVGPFIHLFCVRSSGVRPHPLGLEAFDRCLPGLRCGHVTGCQRLCPRTGQLLSPPGDRPGGTPGDVGSGAHAAAHGAQRIPPQRGHTERHDQHAVDDQGADRAQEARERSAQRVAEPSGPHSGARGDPHGVGEDEKQPGTQQDHPHRRDPVEPSTYAQPVRPDEDRHEDRRQADESIEQSVHDAADDSHHVSRREPGCGPIDISLRCSSSSMRDSFFGFLRLAFRPGGGFFFLLRATPSPMPLSG
jgi:hypothetical protein